MTVSTLYKCDFCSQETKPSLLKSTTFFLKDVESSSSYNAPVQTISTLHICVKCTHEHKLWIGDRIKEIDKLTPENKTKTSAEIYLDALRLFMADEINGQTNSITS